MQDEDAKVGRGRELLFDPAVTATADLTVVEVGLRGVDGDDGDAVHFHDRVALAEQLLEVEVADVARVVIPGNDHQGLAFDAVEVALRLRVFLLETERRQITRADDDVRLKLVDLGQRSVQERGHEVRAAAVQVRKVSDAKDPVFGARHVRAKSRGGFRGVGSVRTRCYPDLWKTLEMAAFQAYL